MCLHLLNIENLNSPKLKISNHNVDFCYFSDQCTLTSPFVNVPAHPKPTPSLMTDGDGSENHRRGLKIKKSIFSKNN